MWLLWKIRATVLPPLDWKEGRRPMALTQVIETVQMIENVVELGTDIAPSCFQSRRIGLCEGMSLNTEGIEDA